MCKVRVLALASFLAGKVLVCAGEAGHGWIQGPTESIALSRAIDMALTNNLDAQIDRVALHIARDRVRYAWGAFDPVLSISATRDSIQTPQNATNITNAAELQQVQIAEQTLLVQREIARQLA